MHCKKGVLKNYTKFTEKTPVPESFLIKLQAYVLQLYLKRDWHRCFTIKFAKFLTTVISTEHVRGTASGHYKHHFNFKNQLISFYMMRALVVNTSQAKKGNFINPFGPYAPFLHPLKTSENLMVFCFHGI